MDEETGNSSYLIDLPNGGKSFVIGNLLMHGPNAENRKLISYGAEGLANPDNELYVVNNTMVSKRSAGATFVGIQSGTTVAKIINNLMTGQGIMFTGTADTTSNLLLSDVSQAKFLDEPDYDYHLTSSSPGINQGTNPDSVPGFNLVPKFEYIHPLSYSSRTDNGIDIGAYQWNTTGVEDNSYLSSFLVYPNPVSSTAEISFMNYAPGFISLKMFDMLGREVMTIYEGYFKIGESKFQLNTSQLPRGVYELLLQSNGKAETAKLVVW